MVRYRNSFNPPPWFVLGLSTLTIVTGASSHNIGEFRSYDGTNNNIANPNWGASNQPRVRILPSQEGFYNHLDEPMDEVNSQLPSARRIMERIFSKARPHKDKIASHVLLELGHFIVQDILGSRVNETEPFDIPCDGNVADYVFCPVTGARVNLEMMEAQTIPFHRDQYLLNSRDNPRSTINGMTAFLDLSNLYGTVQHPSDDNSYWEAKYPGGKLPLTDDGLLKADTFNGDDPKAGINTTPGAYALYVLFIRYHNQLAEEFQNEFPDAVVKDIFEAARRKTIAVYQAFVEEKYIPVLLGDKLKDYTGYNAEVDPSIDEFFAAMSFRYAHSSFGNLVRLVDKDFVPFPHDPLLLRDVFRNTIQLVQGVGGIEPFLRGLAITPAKNIDASLVEDFNVWTEATSVLDVQRGRDVGLPRYNDVRESFGLPRMESMEQLVADRYEGGNYHNDSDFNLLVSALRELYHDDIDLVDAYVGALIESPLTKQDNMGPLFTMSIKDQFTRLRDGDRFWYKAIFTEEEYSNFPDLSALVKSVCEGMDLFPDEAYLLSASAGEKPQASDEICSGGSSSQLFLLQGSFSVRWYFDEARDSPEKTIDVTLSINEKMEGAGFLGIGWESSVMHGSKIWFCTVGDTTLETLKPFSRDCAANSNVTSTPFTCCLAEGTHHHRPECLEPSNDNYYTLGVVDWCLSESESSVTVRAPVCDDNGDYEGAESEIGNRCFNMEASPDGGMDFIVAYSTLSNTRAHGFQRRTNAQVDLTAGRMTQSEASIADDGLIATHGAFMLIGWMVLAPFGVFVVRYMKTWKRRLVVHISIMGVVGSMMFPLLIGVEASVGATDKTAQHALVGLIIMTMFFLMAGTGRYRYLKWEGHRIGKKTDIITLAFHKFGGAAFICLAWWNCWTGLCRIGPEDSEVELVLFSSLHLGYNIPWFGFIRDYIYGPYLAFVFLVFVLSEIRRRKSANASQSVIKSGKSLWGDEDDSHLATMTLETFLDVSRMGNALCIVDGRVLDITSFIDNHPGGPELLRYVRGSDITEEFCGVRDVDGIQHVHSHGAVALMKKFVKAKLVGIEGMELEHVHSPRGRSSRTISGLNLMQDFRGAARSRSQPFRRGKVIDVQYLSPSASAEDQQTSPVVLLRLALPRGKEGHQEKKITKFPGCSFRFRGLDKQGLMFEREYTALKLDCHQEVTTSREISLASMNTDQLGSEVLPVSRKSLRDLESVLNSTKHMNIKYNDRKAINESSEKDEVYDFVVSLVPGGQMSEFFQTIKTGKLLLAQGPKINPETVYQVESNKWHSVVMFAGGTGITSMLQMIDYFLEKYRHRNGCPLLFLIWVLKSPEHNYHASLGLKDRLRKSKGCLKWITVYSSSSEDGAEANRLEMERLCSAQEELNYDVATNPPAVEELAHTEAQTPPSIVPLSHDKSRLKRKVSSESDGIPEVRKSLAQQLLRSSKLVSQSLGVELRSRMWMRKRTKLNVRDLISWVRDDNFVVDDVSDIFPDNAAKFDEAFWNRTPRQTACQLDGSTLREIMMSIQGYARMYSSGPDDDSKYDGSDSDEQSEANNKSTQAANVLFFLENNVALADRVRGMKVEKNCFVAKEAIDYLVSFGYASDRHGAVELGRLLQNQNQIFSTSGQKFADSEGLFRFTLVKPGNRIGTSMSDLSTVTEDEIVVNPSNHASAGAHRRISFADAEEGGARQDLFRNTLVAISGPPMFEVDLSEVFRETGLPKEQLLMFTAPK